MRNEMRHDARNDARNEVVEMEMRNKTARNETATATRNEADEKRAKSASSEEKVGRKRVDKLQIHRRSRKDN